MQHQRQRDLALGRRERRQHERVELVEQQRQRDQQRGVRGDGQRRGERLADAQRHRPLRRAARAWPRPRRCAARRAPARLRAQRRVVAAPTRASAPRAGRDLLVEPLLRLLPAVGLLERVARLVARLLDRRLRERPVDRVEDRVVLPQADAERRPTNATRQMMIARPQLVEVLDEREPVLVRDGLQPGGHGAAAERRARGRAQRALAHDLAVQRRLLAVGTAQRGRPVARGCVVVAVGRPVLPRDGVLELADARRRAGGRAAGSRLPPTITSTISSTMSSSSGPKPVDECVVMATVQLLARNTRSLAPADPSDIRRARSSPGCGTDVGRRPHQAPSGTP